MKTIETVLETASGEPDSLSPSALIARSMPRLTVVKRDLVFYKRMIDVVVALMLIVATAPLLVIIALLVASSGGPILFKQARIGRQGVLFNCYKFRSMVPDAEARLEATLAADPEMRHEWETTRKLKKDPRITLTGRFLRKSSLDELPQLINVVLGHMSLVGPRPIVDAERHRYGRYLHAYYAVRPGMTGLWQVSGRSNVSYRRRVAMDVTYVRRLNARLDAQLLLRTVRVVFFRSDTY